jgi:uncharacterized cupin superfamily protein
MSSSTGFTALGAVDESKSEPFEVGRVQWLRRPGDGGRDDVSAGFWFVTPEDAPAPFDVPSEADETIALLQGHLRIALQDGTVYDVVPGTSVAIDKGVTATWTVLEPSVEFFVYA